MESNQSGPQACRKQASENIWPRWIELFLLYFLGAGIVYSSSILILSWKTPLLDQHAFRQTQTALSVQWMAHGRPLLAYETPIVGFPWTIPFEFPLFQWSALLLHRLGVDLDNAGRVASWLYFIAGLPIAAFTMRKWGADRQFTLIFLALWTFSPLYAYWSRSYMIESCATFFGLLFLAGLSNYLQLATQKAPVKLVVLALGLATAAAVVAGLVKVTTFFSFGLAGGGLTLWSMWTILRERKRLWETLAVGVGPAFMVGASLVATAMWVRHIDAAKAQAPIAALMTSVELRSWNFGWEQIFKPITWTKVIFGRAPLDAVGSRFPLLLALVLVTMLPKARPYVICGFSLYLAPFFAFTNLHFVHNYYQYANAFFLIFAVAGSVWALGADAPNLAGASRNLSSRAIVPLMLILVIGDLSAFQSRFLPALWPSPAKDRTLELAAWIKGAVPPDDVVFIFGRDWSAELPYYAERRAVMFPSWASAAVAQRSPRDLDLWTGGRRVGAIVDCGQPNAALKAWARSTEVGRIGTSVAGCEVYRQQAAPAMKRRETAF